MSEKREAWKLFLKGRIAQEEGKVEEGIKLLEDAIKLDPDNTFFLKARSYALAQLKKPEDAVVNQLRSGYAELAKKYSGSSDEPGPWIEGLKQLQIKAEAGEIDTQLVAMAW